MNSPGDRPELRSSLQLFPPIALGDLGRVKLMDREDTKFIFHEDQLGDVLSQLRGSYQVLEIESTRLFQYDTRYLDTPDLGFYMQHHNGRRPRIKIRYRRYHQPAAVYFEIKTKNNRNRTTKQRFSVDEVSSSPGARELDFLKQHLGSCPALQTTLDVRFFRFTLVHKSEPDRITIDVGLETRGPGEWYQNGNLVIAEIKQPRYRPDSIFFKVMQSANIPEMRLSKYCLGMLQTWPGIKYNRFKPKLLRLNQILNTRQNTEILNA